MILYFQEVIRERGLTVLQAFQVAYYYVFDKQGEIGADYCQYILHGVLPKYVIKWVKSLQQGEVK